jgi:hypothetical protein
MSRNSIPPTFAAQCAAELQRAWPELRVLQFECDVESTEYWTGPHTEPDLRIDVFAYLTVSGTEPALIAAGLLSREAVDSIPPCGSCRRDGWSIRRGKRSTRLEGGHGLDSLLAPILVPAMVWKPPQTA